MSKADDAKILELARKRFQIGQEALGPQLKRELDDLNFEFEPWAEDAIKARQGGIVGGIAIPPRPMLKIPTLDQPLQLVENQEKAAHLEPQIQPEGEDGSDETAKVMQALYRDIANKSRAYIARDWAFRRKIRCGRGWWRVNKVWANETDEGPGAFDQKITIDRILNQASVTPDPFAQQPDWSDGKWAFVGGFMPCSELAQRYKNYEEASSEDWTGLGDQQPRWFKDDGGVKAERVTEYWAIETTYTTIKDQGRERTKETNKVLWYKITAHQILDREEWDGPDIPLVPDVGRESNIDGERRWEGITSKAKDPVRWVNWTATNAVEKMAMGVRAPYEMWEGQQEGHEQELAEANTRNFPYLLFKPVYGLNGEPLDRPTRNLQGPDLSSDLMMYAQAKEAVSTATFAFAPTLGKPDAHRSGKAVQSLQQQADEGNSNYLDDHAQIAVTREAQIVMGLMPFVYDRDERIVQVLGKDDELSKVMLNVPYVKGDNGKPQRVPPGTKDALHYNLKNGKYSVAVTVAKSYPTLRKEGADKLGELVQAVPETFPILGWRLVGNMDFPGAKEASEDLKKLIPDALKDKDQPDPRALQAQLGQMQQQMQLMQQVIAGQQHVLETKQIEAKTKLQLADLQAQEKADTADKDRAAKIYIAELGAKVDRLQLTYEALQNTTDIAHDHAMAAAQAGHEEHMAGLQQQHDASMAAAGAGNDAAQAERGHQQALEQGAQGHAQNLEAAEQGHGQAMEQAQQAADLAPEPQEDDGA